MMLNRRTANRYCCLLLPPYRPNAFSSTYSTMAERARGGSLDEPNMRLMIIAERPELLWRALRMVHAVLRASPSASACSSSVRNPASIRACPSSWILANWRAFMSATTPGFVAAFGGTAMLFASAERTLVMEDPSVGPQWCTLATPRIAEVFTARLAGPATPAAASSFWVRDPIAASSCSGTPVYWNRSYQR